MHNRAKEDSSFNAVAREKELQTKNTTLQKNFKGPGPSEANLLLQCVMQLKVSLSHHAPCLVPTTASADTILAQILNNSRTSWSTKYTSTQIVHTAQFKGKDTGIPGDDLRTDTL